jgi:hypothetical protein
MDDPLLVSRIVTSILSSLNSLLLTYCFLFRVAAFKVWLPTIAQHFMQIVGTDLASNLTLCKVIGTSLERESMYPVSVNVKEAGTYYSFSYFVA